MDLDSLEKLSIPQIAEKIQSAELQISTLGNWIQFIEHQIAIDEAQAYFDACKLDNVKSEESKRQAVITLMSEKEGHPKRVSLLMKDKKSLDCHKADHAFYKRIFAFKMAQLAHQ